MYELYTFPACEKCARLKEQLKSRGIAYEEVNAGLGDGRIKLKELTKQYHEQLKRDNSGWLILPMVVSRNDGSIEIFQGEECLEKILLIAR